MKMPACTVLIIGVAAIGLPGCSVGPDYREPEVAVPSDWGEPKEGGLTKGQAEVSRWWATFHDPILDSLVERAVKANYDLRIADARLLQARAEREAVGAEFWPSANASASYARQRTSGNIPLTQQGVGSPAGIPLETDLYQSGFDAAWEIDVFGGKRRLLEAATADLAASEEARRGALVSLLAEVARNYVELRGLQQRLQIVRNTLASQRETLEITRQRFQGALASELDVTQAATLLAGTQSQMPLLEASIRQMVHQLSVLLGQPPDELAGELSPEASIPTTPPDVPVGLPSDLLRRRPDIRLAERQLASATAEIGVQMAELFPKFSLTGDIGLQSTDASDWFTSGSRYWSFGPMVRWRIFDAGRIRAQIRVRTALQEQALATYEKTVLTSLQEVEDAMVAYSKEKVRSQSLKEQVESSQRSLEIANDRYVRGLGSFLDVLDTQRSSYQAQDQLVQSEQAICRNLIAIYKALGGGWGDFESPSGTPAAAVAKEADLNAEGATHGP